MRAKMVFVLVIFVFFGVNYANAAIWEILNMPGSKLDSTQVTAIDGNNAIGQYRSNTDNNPHAFLYNVDEKKWTTIDPSGSIGAWPVSVSGSQVVGGYNVSE